MNKFKIRVDSQSVYRILFFPPISARSQDRDKKVNIEEGADGWFGRTRIPGPQQILDQYFDKNSRKDVDD